jgi:hypothetical protein
MEFKSPVVAKSIDCESEGVIGSESTFGVELARGRAAGSPRRDLGVPSEGKVWVVGLFSPPSLLDAPRSRELL